MSDEEYSDEGFDSYGSGDFDEAPVEEVKKSSPVKHPSPRKQSPRKQPSPAKKASPLKKSSPVKKKKPIAAAAPVRKPKYVPLEQNEDDSVDDDKMTLESFDETLTAKELKAQLSPRSLTALQKCGSTCKTILPISDEVLVTRFPDIAGNDELITMAADHYERKRTRALEQAIQARAEAMDAAMKRAPSQASGLTSPGTKGIVEREQLRLERIKKKKQRDVELQTFKVLKRKQLEAKLKAKEEAQAEIEKKREERRKKQMEEEERLKAERDAKRASIARKASAELRRKAKKAEADFKERDRLHKLNLAQQAEERRAASEQKAEETRERLEAATARERKAKKEKLRRQAEAEAARVAALAETREREAKERAEASEARRLRHELILAQAQKAEAEKKRKVLEKMKQEEKRLEQKQRAESTERQKNKLRDALVRADLREKQKKNENIKAYKAQKAKQKTLTVKERFDKIEAEKEELKRQSQELQEASTRDVQLTKFLKFIEGIDYAELDFTVIARKAEVLGIEDLDIEQLEKTLTAKSSVSSVPHRRQDVSSSRSPRKKPQTELDKRLLALEKERLQAEKTINKKQSRIDSGLISKSPRKARPGSAKKKRPQSSKKRVSATPNKMSSTISFDSKVPSSNSKQIYSSSMDDILSTNPYSNAWHGDGSRAKTPKKKKKNASLSKTTPARKGNSSKKSKQTSSPAPVSTTSGRDPARDQQLVEQYVDDDEQFRTVSGLPVPSRSRKNLNDFSVPEDGEQGHKNRKLDKYARAEAEAYMEQLANDQNVQLMDAVHKELEIEERRGYALKRVKDETERERLEIIFRKERAIASRRIEAMTRENEEILAQQMETLGLLDD